MQVINSGERSVTRTMNEFQFITSRGQKETLCDIAANLLLPQELTQVAQDIVLVCKKNCADDPSISMILNVLNSDVTTLEGILHRNPGNYFTEKVLLKDEERDSLYLAFCHYIYAWTIRVDEPEKANAALRILSIIKNRGGDFLDLGYARETAELASFFTEMSTDSAQRDLISIGADSWLDSLKKSQEEFEAIYLQSLTGRADQEYPLLREARIQLANSLDGLLSYLSLRIRARDDRYISLAEKINELVRNIARKGSNILGE